MLCKHTIFYLCKKGDPPGDSFRTPTTLARIKTEPKPNRNNLFDIFGFPEWISLH